MKNKYLWYGLLSGLSLSGCSVLNGSGSETATVSRYSQEAVKLTPAQNQQIIDDAVLALVGRYPPAKTTLRYQASQGVFGQTLEKTLRQAGFALVSHQATAQKAANPDAQYLAMPELHTTLDQIQGWPMYRLTLTAGDWQMNKAYRLDSSGKLQSSGITIQGQQGVTPAPVIKQVAVRPAQPRPEAASTKARLVSSKTARAKPENVTPPQVVKRAARPAPPVTQRVIVPKKQAVRKVVNRTPPPQKRPVRARIDPRTQQLIRQHIPPARRPPATVIPVTFKPPVPAPVALPVVKPPLQSSAVSVNVPPPPQMPVIPQNAVKVDVQQLLNPGSAPQPPQMKRGKLTRPQKTPASGVKQLPLPPLTPPAPAGKRLQRFAYVQVMAGRNQQDLKKHQRVLQKQGYKTRLQRLKRLTALRVVTSSAQAGKVRSQMRHQGYRDAYILRGSGS